MSGNINFNGWINDDGSENYKCRAWVNFNGTGTVAIRAAGNVSSITDLGAGQYRANFATAMPDGNFCTTVACSGGGSAWIASMGSDIGYPATTSVGLQSGYPNSWAVDAPYIMCAVFR